MLDAEKRPLSEQEVLDVLGKTNAVITGSHIVYTSGKHGTAYVNKDAIYPHTASISQLCRTIAEEFKNSDVEVVVAPAVGGVVMTQWVAHHLSEIYGHEVLAVYAEKEQIAIPDPEGLDRKCFAETGEFVIKRGYDKLISGKRTLVLEDVVTTGGSVGKVVKSTRGVGGIIVGVGILCNRGGITAEQLDTPELFALTNVELDAWDEDQVPQWLWERPINTDVGKGAAFLARMKQKQT
jgi:orotate phosphoribosyltransferase